MKANERLCVPCDRRSGGKYIAKLESERTVSQPLASIEAAVLQGDFKEITKIRDCPGRR